MVQNYQEDKPHRNLTFSASQLLLFHIWVHEYVNVRTRQIDCKIAGLAGTHLHPSIVLPADHYHYAHDVKMQKKAVCWVPVSHAEIALRPVADLAELREYARLFLTDHLLRCRATSSRFRQLRGTQMPPGDSVHTIPPMLQVQRRSRQSRT